MKDGAPTHPAHANLFLQHLVDEEDLAFISGVQSRGVDASQVGLELLGEFLGRVDDGNVILVLLGLLLLDVELGRGRVALLIDG